MALLTNINGKFSVSDVGAVTFNNAFTFPTTDGAANYVLQTNGSGQLAWALNGNGDISGSGTANTVTKFTGAKTIGDGPITFSGNNSTFTGNVGIGTTSLSAKLMIETGSDEGIRIYRSGANANFGAIEFRNSDDSATNSRIGFNANEMRLEATNQFRFVTNSSDKMFINSIGNVGIGTTSPSAPLHISNTYPVIRLTDSDGTAPYAQIINSSGILQLRADDGNSTANSSMQFFVDGTERLTINSSGNATFTGTISSGAITAPTFSGDLNGTINTVTTATTKGNSTNDTTVATTAFVQNVIGTIPAGLVFQGTWNADTNSPTLTSGSGTTGNFYIVSVAGSTNLDGITDWQVGDWAVFIEQGASDQWEKIDNSSVLGGSGTGGSFAGWSGSGTSVTLGNAPVTFSGNNSTFAGNINTGAAKYLRFNPAASGSDAAILFGNTSGTGGSLKFKRNSDSAVILTLDGDKNATFTGNITGVGASFIGTAASSAALVTIENNSGSTATSYGLLVIGGGNSSNGRTFEVRDASGNTDLIVKGNGNVGIGTDSPGTYAKLEVSTSQQYMGIVLSNGTDNVGWISGNSASNDNGQLSLLSAGVQKVQINANSNSYFNGGNVGIGVSTPTSKLHINQSVTDPDLDFPSSFAVEIDSNHSGSAATTGDREQGGLYIDVDSSTTGGDLANEHRLYGIYNTVNHSGDSDAVYGTYSLAEQNTTAGTTTNLFAVNATTISDGGANAAVTNVAAVYGGASMQDSTPVGNSHAGKFLNNSISNRAGLTSNTYGISVEIQIDSTSAHTNLYAGRFSIDSNAAYTATSSYLLYLDYQGTSLATNTYAIYSLSDVKSYHEGDLGIGTDSPGYKLDVVGSIKASVQGRFASGSAATPSYSFDADSDSGMFRATTNALGFSTAGTERMVISSAGAIKFNAYGGGYLSN